MRDTYAQWDLAAAEQLPYLVSIKPLFESSY